MSDQEMKDKIAKSKRYAEERSRFKMLSIKIGMQSRHGERTIEYSEKTNSWTCTCDFFGQRETCSHIMAAERMLNSVFGDLNIHTKEKMENDSK